jgi:molybdate transport system substrate-binding protein
MAQDRASSEFPMIERESAPMASQGLSPRRSSARRRLLRQALAAVASVAVPGLRAQPPQATVAAASDLKFALDELATGFARAGGARLRLVFGSSGNLSSQILQGAPFHLFLSADEAFVFRLADAGRTVDRGRLYALGRIGLLVPQGSPLEPDGRLRDLRAAIADGRLRRFAIANPAHAPYGMRAREALQHARLWDAVQPHLVLGENVAQAAQFATSGAVQGGLVAHSIALAPAVARIARFDLVPATWHRPLRQRMVLLRGAPAAARDFYDHLSTPAAQAALARHGFELPQASARE